jgi:hypothetical protein
MKLLSKKDLHKKRPNHKQKGGHWEGKYWCDCKAGNYRRWLGFKKYGGFCFDALRCDGFC